MKFIYNHIMCVKLNIKSDYCQMELACPFCIADTMSYKIRVRFAVAKRTRVLLTENPDGITWKLLQR